MYFTIAAAVLCGFVYFYGQHQALARSSKREVQARAGQVSNWLYHFQICGFAVYVWLVTYLQVNSIEEVQGSTLFYTIAMGMHFFLIEYALKREQGAMYSKTGKNILAAAALLGWGVGVFFVMSVPVVITLMSFVAGGIIMNTMMLEMPREQESRFLYFLAGVFLYSGLIFLCK